MGNHRPGTIVLSRFPESRWDADCATSCITHLLEGPGYLHVARLIMQDKREDEAPDGYTDLEISDWMRLHLRPNNKSIARVLSSLTGEEWIRWNLSTVMTLAEYAFMCRDVPKIAVVTEEDNEEDLHISAVKYGVVYDIWDSLDCTPVEVMVPKVHNDRLPF